MTKEDDPSYHHQQPEPQQEPMTNNAQHLDNNNNPEENDLGSEAAGVVRGVSRSLGRTAARPMIGRLPRPAPKLQVPKPKIPSVPKARIPQPRVPPPKAARIPHVKQVARVSDRLSTGYDWWSTAVESTSTSTERWKQVRAFVGNLVKNTILGMAVFESYGYVVGQMAPAAAESMHNSKIYVASNDSVKNLGMDDDDDDDDVSPILLLEGAPDEYARASVKAHWTAGAVAGSVHGVATSVLETNLSAKKLWLQQAAYHTLHHTLAHSVLFGSYEFLKRSIFQQLSKNEHVVAGEDKLSYLAGSHLAGFAVAGGLAGQLQHLVSHYTESLTFESGITSTKLSHRLVVPSAPAMRPLLMAFPPSAIGFVAFEYGKSLTS